MGKASRPRIEDNPAAGRKRGGKILDRGKKKGMTRVGKPLGRRSNASRKKDSIFESKKGRDGS